MRLPHLSRAFEVFYSLRVRSLDLGVAATAIPHDAHGGRELLDRLAHAVFLMAAPE